MQILDVKKKVPKLLKKWIWERLGLHLGRFGGGLGRDLGSLGASSAVFGSRVVVLVFEVVFEGAFEGIWP